MSASDSGAVSPVPEHLHTVTPRLVVSDGAAAIAFYGRAFGAGQIGERFTGPSTASSVIMTTESPIWISAWISSPPGPVNRSPICPAPNARP